MKRSLFIAIVVLLMAALFVSCNAEKSMEDQLVEVTIDGGARALSATGTSSIPSVESLYWYFVAEKNDNSRFSTGATTWKAVSTDPGLAGASLGKFSTGFWKFSFYGFVAEQTTKPENLETTAVYKCEGMSVGVNGAAISLTVTLDFAGSVSNGVVEFGAITFTGTADYKVVVLDKDNNNAVVASSEYVPATNGTVSMTPHYGEPAYAFEAGDHTLTIKVYEKITENNNPENFIETIVSDDDVVFKLQPGIKITIKGSAVASEVTYLVNIDGTVTQASVDLIVDAADDTTVEANVTPAEYGVSSVTFPAGSLESGNYALDMEVSGAAADFTVSSGIQGVPVAGIALNLTKENDSAFSTDSFGGNQKVTVTTYIPKGLDAANLKVYYGTEEIEVVRYTPETGELIFKTAHFSDFVVVAENIEAINLTQNKAYASLSEAVEGNQGDTILVMKDCELGSSINYCDLYVGKLDLGGHTITLTMNTYLNSNVTVCNGSFVNSTIPGKWNSALIAWQNESNIVLNDVNITARTTDNTADYPTDAYALYVMTGASVVIDGGVYDGYFGTNGGGRNVELTINGGEFIFGAYFPAYGTYVINDGTFDDLVEIKSGTLTINGGSFNCGTAGEAQYIAYENGNAIHNAALGAVAYNGNVTPDNNYGPTPVVNINGGTFNGAICKARKTADIDYPTFNIASGLTISVVDLGLTD